MISDLLFFVAVSCLLVHEMDGVDKREWRLIFVLRRLPVELGMRWFVALHLPLYIALMVLVAADESAITRWLQASVDVFSIVHFGLHERFAARGEQAFANSFSRALIWGAAGFALLHLVVMSVDAF